MGKMEIKKEYYIYAGLIIIFISIFIFNNISKNKYTTEMHFLELPTGDCTFIKTSERSILIGAATKKDSKYIKEYLKNNNINKITDLILTYPNKNNVEGFIPLLEQTMVEKIYVSNNTDLDSDTKAFISLAKDKNIEILQTKNNEKWKSDDLTLLFLRPTSDSTVPPNKRKFVIKLKLPKLSVLWLPPFEGMDRTDLLLDSKDLKADILKISGEDKTAVLTNDFLDAVKPHTIIYGDSEKVKEKELRAIYGWNADAQVVSIDEEGEIIFYGIDKGYGITTERRMNIKIQ